MYYDDFEFSRAFVFREIELDGVVYYLHFKLCDSELDIVPDVLLDNTQHMHVLNYD